MENLLRPFVAWVTALRHDLFRWAKIKLSFLYLAILAVILALYSAAIYTNVADHVRDYPLRIQNPGEQTLSDEAVDATRHMIFLVDGIVFVIAAGFSYLLAGYTLRPIRRALESQEAFAADASHELRTPLAVMRTDIEVFLRSGEPVSVAARDVLESNLEEVTSLSLLAEELLALSRGVTESSTHWINIELGVLVRAVGEKFKNLAAEKKIPLTMGKLDPVRVLGESRSLERVFVNLFMNAIAYTPRGGKISVSVSHREGWAEVKITDTGIGIAPSDIPHIFDRFYKVDSARTEGKSGAGLGLSIVRQIVEQHQGTVHIESVFGKGTTVTVRIPGFSPESSS
jgi:signal transduction histidine kinase